MNDSKSVEISERSLTNFRLEQRKQVASPTFVWQSVDKNAIKRRRNSNSVISISWGGPEASWTFQAMQTFDQAFQDAAALGVTICCASGDNGSADMAQNWDGKAHVDFPASSPSVLGCGGTHVDTSAGAITQEVVMAPIKLTRVGMPARG